MKSVLSDKAKKLLMSPQGPRILEELFSKQGSVRSDQFAEHFDSAAETQSQSARNINMSAPVKAVVQASKPDPVQVIKDFVELTSRISRETLSEVQAEQLNSTLNRALEILGPSSEHDQSPFFSPSDVDGDILPKVGDMVLIHLARQNEWVAHQVVGFYAWKDLNGSNSSVRLFVQVRDSNGNLNARLLYDVLRMDKTPFLP